MKEENKTDQPANLVDAINYVMRKAKSVEKNLTVGTGNNQYPGVSHKDVKELLQPLLAEAGLIIIPTKIVPTVTVDRWEETGHAYGKEIIRRKMRVLTEVLVTYRLQHVGGEFIDLQGYGHGLDNQDKSAGKSTTYALKYLLIYTFLIPTGKIDDADGNASEPTTEIKEKKPISQGDWGKATGLIRTGKYTAEKLQANYDPDEDQLKELDEIVRELDEKTWKL